MTRAPLLALLLLAACDKKPAPASASGQPAPVGLPPLGEGPADPQPVAPAPMANPHGAAPAPGGPSGAVEGSIRVGSDLKDKVKPGDVVFIVARSVDASGQVQRMPLAVDRLTIPEGGAPLPFHLSSDKAMMPGTPFAGTIQVTARLDRDGDAMTRTPGDIEGILQVTVPAKDLEIVLDKPVL